MFVAYYNLEKISSNDLLLIIVGILGLIASISWRLTVLGHYHWMLSFIDIVQKYETKLSELSEQSGRMFWYVYSVYCPRKENFDNVNVSTQKITSRFTFLITIAWAVILIFDLYKKLYATIEKICCTGGCVSNKCLAFFIPLIITIVIYSLAVFS